MSSSDLSCNLPMKGNTREFWILDSKSWIPESRYWIPVFVSGTWSPDSNCQWDSGFQSPAFRIPRAKVSHIPNTTSKIFPDSHMWDDCNAHLIYDNSNNNMQKR